MDGRKDQGGIQRLHDQGRPAHGNHGPHTGGDDVARKVRPGRDAELGDIQLANNESHEEMDEAGIRLFKRVPKGAPVVLRQSSCGSPLLEWYLEMGCSVGRARFA